MRGPQTLWTGERAEGLWRAAGTRQGCGALVNGVELCGFPGKPFCVWPQAQVRNKLPHPGGRLAARVLFLFSREQQPHRA